MGIAYQEGMSVFIDTAPLIYFWERNEQFFQPMSHFFDQVYALNIQCIVSYISYIELITKPLKEKRKNIASKYRDYLTNSSNFQIYPLNLLVADKTAAIRSLFNLKTPDAIQLATANICGADMILTNDRAWKPLEKSLEAKIILVEELAE